MGYTYLLVQDLSQAVYYHHMLSSLIRTIILQDDLVQKCRDDPDFCAQSPQNPHGIPLWKILAFHFWGGKIPSIPQYQLFDRSVLILCMFSLL